MHRIVTALAIMAISLAAIALTSAAARAEVVVSINKSTQTMVVTVDGVERYRWAVSTGLGGGPPSGAYRPQRLERKWWSHKYGRAPMPHSIFFHEGYAIHGTTFISRLGRRASHGCVRLHPANAAILFDLVRKAGLAQTRIVVGTSHVAAGHPSDGASGR